MTYLFFSVKALHEKLQWVLYGPLEGKKEIVISYSKDKQLVVDGQSYGYTEAVTYRQSAFEMTVKISQLKRLERVLKILQEQPICLGFDPANSWIWIKEAAL
jgi:hypothetical protein